MHNFFKTMGEIHLKKLLPKKTEKKTKKLAKCWLCDLTIHEVEERSIDKVR